MSDPLTIEAHGTSYRIISPGGRIGSKLERGIPYEHALLEQIWRLGLEGSAFDVGAHVGNHSLWLAAVCGLKVHAFEPHPKSLPLLQESVALNPFDITIHAWGAGAAHARARFTPGMWLSFDPERDGEKLTLDRGHVEVHPIDEMLDVEDLVLIKVDVEGMEADVLRGATRHIIRSRPEIFAETHTKKARRRTDEVLVPLGYHLKSVIQMGSPMGWWTP